MDFDIVDKLGAADRCPIEEFWDSLTWFTMPMVWTFSLQTIGCGNKLLRLTDMVDAWTRSFFNAAMNW